MLTIKVLFLKVFCLGDADYNIFQINNIIMIIEQLPSLEEIYDFSSQDLKKIVQDISYSIANGKLNKEEQLKFQDYIENVNTQLEERKTLEFFQQLCALDNPYLKKVTDFNNQFLKLASEAIAAQQSDTDLPQQLKIDKIVGIKDVNKQSQDEINDGVSVASTKTRLTQMMSNKFGSNESDNNYTVTGEKKSADFYQKKMKIGNRTSKASKNTMKDFILSTLNKNKAEGCYVVKKAGNAPQKIQPTYTVNERGHLVNPHTLEPITTKNIKSTSTVQQKSATGSIASSYKNISESANRIDEKQLDRKRQEAVEKVKGIKSQKKKQKLFNNKDLVEMIRQEEKKKQNKRQQEEEVKKKKGDEAIQNREFNTSSIQQTKVESQQTKDQIKATNMKEETIIVSTEKISLQSKQKIEIKSQLPQYVQKIMTKQKIIQNITIIKEKKEKLQKLQKQQTKDKIQKKINTEQFCNPYHELDIDMIKKSTQKEGQHVIIPLQLTERQRQKFKTQEIDVIHRDKESEDYAKELQQITKMKEEIQKQKIIIERTSVTKNITKVEEQTSRQFGVIVDIPAPTSQIEQVVDKTNLPSKRCYNEEYWIHIREQAERQIQRYKQQKQLQEISRVRLKNKLQNTVEQSNRTQSLQKQQLLKEIQNDQQQKAMAEQPEVKTEEKNEQNDFVEKRRKQLKQMVNQHNKRVPSKRPPMPIYAPPKPLYALPAFNYLQIYPTFNHIFSVMYTKAQHQALLDIPMLMRDLTNMFTTHLQHFKEKSGGYFQPAIFLPFDTSNNFNLTDPRQLLIHAQNTYVNLKKIVERTQIFNGNLHGQFNTADNRYYRVVKTKEEVYDIISTGFLRRKGWKQLPHGCSLRSSWNLFWSWSKPDVDVSKLLVWQRINHYPFNKNLSRKDLLYKNLDSFRKMMKIQFNFLPLTFNLPKQFTQFCIKFHEEEISNRDRNYWIMKPIGKSRGRGISVINNLAQLNYTDNIVVQKYIANPLLLDGYKFDMRIYVLVTNFHPLQAFIYKEGFARLSTQKFSLEPMYIKNTFMHLTNFAINRNNEEAKQSANFSGGSKISLKVLKDKITKMNYSFNNIWSQVIEIIIKSLLGCSISVPAFPTAFELFGYDIMIDTDSNCHLIQINASPSLQRSYLIDQIVKQSLIDDILDIVDPPDFDKEQLLDIMSERLAGKKKITPEQDLIAIARILKYKKLRKFGEIPENMGLFDMIAPSPLSTELERLIKGRSGANNPKNID